MNVHVSEKMVPEEETFSEDTIQVAGVKDSFILHSTVESTQNARNIHAILLPSMNANFVKQQKHYNCNK